MTDYDDPVLSPSGSPEVGLSPNDGEAAGRAGRHEPPQENVRNALAVLDIARQTAQLIGNCGVVLTGDEYDAVVRRLWMAIRQLEGGAV